MNNRIFLIALCFLLSCSSDNRKQLQNKSIISEKMLEQQYDSLLVIQKGKDHYEEIIPLLESGLVKFEQSDIIYNKIKLDLAGYYLTDYFMDPSGSDTSLNKSIKMFDEILQFDQTKQFFFNELGFRKSKIDSIHNIWDSISNNSEKLEFLDVTLNEFRNKLKK